ncbi:hypothetical protein Aca07nite_49110 [Actinoplanes capillaceus]|uniref:Uncharacterized protein n=1 Tax=Actinoplanes campanulatus TaxID=113559 RepID=A0ABQ3WN24_9ACTN|nr:hypothetical protein [Actinoplanes capillaceus]GID47636.1 hypothetical protein Aca07nite_49110 [Actinoplanes capillaceus]
MPNRIPNTITDQQWNALGRRAQKANPDVLSDKATRRRLDSLKQRGKADQS